MLSGLTKLCIERNKLKIEIEEKQRKADLITKFVRKTPKCSSTYADLFLNLVNNSYFDYDEIISKIGIDKWL